MAYSFRHTNPRLAGVIIKEQVRCGKPNCRCEREKRLHKWYHYLYWRDYKNDGLLKKEYVSEGRLKKLKHQITSAKAKDREEKINLKMCLKYFREMLS